MRRLPLSSPRRFSSPPLPSPPSSSLLREEQVKYDNFAWRIYKSPHFEVYYYPSSSSTSPGSPLLESGY